MEIKYCFLDIDGVLLDVRNAIIFYDKNKKIPSFIKSNITALNQLNIDRIVIISTWRFNFNKEQLNAIFKQNGVVCDIYDYIETPEPDQFNFITVDDTPTLIKKYIAENNVEYFIVIDDKNEHCQPFPNNSIKTNPYIGFDASFVTVAQNILNKKTP